MAPPQTTLGYTLPHESGGDTPANMKIMDACVARLVAKGQSEESAVAQCKVTMLQRKRITKR